MTFTPGRLLLLAVLASCSAEDGSPSALGSSGAANHGGSGGAGPGAEGGVSGVAAGGVGEAEAGSAGGDCSDAAACAEAERCADGIDNDLDGDSDCQDSECELSCSSACSAPEILSDPARVDGSNVERAGTLELGCHAGPPPGGEVVYELDVEHDGMLDVTVESGQLFRVAVRGSCEKAGTERACGLAHIFAPVRRGETLFVIVQGLESGDASSFALHVASRPGNVCGDGIRDSGEQCDDEGVEPGDGCDARCIIEASETEPNDTLDAANAWSDPFYARIGSIEDVDLVSIDVLQPDTTLVASTSNLGDGACARDELDSTLELLSSTGAVLASDDDGGDGLCARLAVPDLEAGRFYLRVRAAPEADPETFPYRLVVDFDRCGDGRSGPLEGCDDGNGLDGDGCSASCRVE